MRRDGTKGKNSSILETQLLLRPVNTFQRILEKDILIGLVTLYVLRGQEHTLLSEFWQSALPGTVIARGGLFPRMRYWACAEVLTDKGGEVQGIWRVTDTGAAFVEGRLKLPAALAVVESEVIRPTRAPVGIASVIGWRYAYPTAKQRIQALVAQGQSAEIYFDNMWKGP